jgi:hypothetical protein
MGKSEVMYMQMWYCENELCGVCINEGRYQCAGCASWFCGDCVHSFLGTGRWVCLACQEVWENLCRIQAEMCCAVCGKVREQQDMVLCSACQGLFQG